MSKNLTKSGQRFFTTKNMTMIAVFTAMSYVLYMFVKFPLPFIFPEFLDFQISDVPALLGGFMLNPISGCLIVLLKCLLKMPFSSTLCVGEIADILIGIAFVLPSSLLYRKFRSKKGALASLGLGILCSVAVSILANAFLLIPFYVKVMFNGNWEILLNMVRPIFPSIAKDSFYSFYLPLSILPFNILRCFLSGGITFLVYKKLEKFIGFVAKKATKKKTEGELSVENDSNHKS